ncbi:MAG: hypothetical protein WCS77_00100 [Elusimicrobiaceae bacterium]
MANKKISELTELTAAAASDLLPIATATETKKISVANFLGGFSFGAGPVSSMPEAPSTYMLFMDTDNGNLMVYNGIEWKMAA